MHALAIRRADRAGRTTEPFSLTAYSTRARQIQQTRCFHPLAAWHRKPASLLLLSSLFAVPRGSNGTIHSASFLGKRRTPRRRRRGTQHYSGRFQPFLRPRRQRAGHRDPAPVTFTAVINDSAPDRRQSLKVPSNEYRSREASGSGARTAAAPGSARARAVRAGPLTSGGHARGGAWRSGAGRGLGSSPGRTTPQKAVLLHGASERAQDILHRAAKAKIKSEGKTVSRSLRLLTVGSSAAAGTSGELPGTPCSPRGASEPWRMASDE